MVRRMSDKPRSSEGSIKKLGHNHYKITITVGRSKETGAQKRKSKTVKCSLRDTQKQMREMLAVYSAGDIVIDMPTAEFFTDKYFPHVKKSVRATTARSYESAIKRIEEAPFARIKISELYKHVYAVEEWLGEMSGGEKLNSYKMLRQGSRAAKKWHMTIACVTDSIDEPKLEKKAKETIASKDVGKYTKALRGSNLEPGILIAISCGLRRSEIIALDWSDIDFSKADKEKGYLGEINVWRGCHETPGGGMHFDDPKSRKSNRKVLIASWAGKRLKQLAGKGPVMIEDGHRMHPDRFSKLWQRFCEKEKLKFINLKNLRHTCGTILAREAGIPVADIQQMLGHESTATTETFYIQESEAAVERAAGAMNALISA